MVKRVERREEEEETEEEEDEEEGEEAYIVRRGLSRVCFLFSFMFWVGLGFKE